MDFKQTLSNCRKSTQNQAPKIRNESNIIQDLTKLSKKGLLGFTRPNLKKMINTIEKDGQTIKQCQEIQKYYRCIKIIIIFDVMFQFSLLLGLILVQCISSSFQDSIFTFMLVILIVVHVLTLGASINLQGAKKFKELGLIRKRQGEKQKGVITGEEKMMPTVPKINEDLQIRLAKKTKKLQYANNVKTSPENTQQTIKKDPITIIENNNRNEEQVKLNDHKRYAFCFFKVIRIILCIIFPTICLAKLTDDNHENIIKALSICIYFITIVFSTALAFICKSFLALEGNAIIHPVSHIEIKQPRVQIIESCYDRPGPHTKISIQQLISVHIASRKKTFSIQRDFSSSKPSPSQSNSLAQRQHSNHSYQCARDKKQVQRIVLKSSKSNLKKIRKEIEDNFDRNNQLCMERKRVQINSNKIQYFQYSEITQSYHSHSIVEDMEAIEKLKRKAKYSGQKSKYIQDRIHNQTQILKKLRKNRQKMTKSSILFSGNNQIDHKELEKQIQPSLVIS